MSKSYLTVKGSSENTTEIKRSKFIATLAHVDNAEEAERFVRSVRKKYSDATHNCYAYVADEKGLSVRFSDDGEPSGTAGQPMLEVLKKRGLYKTAVVVTRYFGGIKLGASGLVGAYADSVAQALDAACLAEMRECALFRFRCGYSEYACLEQGLLRAGAVNERTEYGDEVEAEFYADRDAAAAAVEYVSAATNGKVRAQITGEAFRSV